MAIFLCPEKHHLNSIVEILVFGPVTMPAMGQHLSAGTLSAAASVLQSGTCPVGKTRHQQPFHGGLGPAQRASPCVSGPRTIPPSVQDPLER